jgi:hypothetical protein
MFDTTALQRIAIVDEVLLRRQVREDPLYQRLQKLADRMMPIGSLDAELLRLRKYGVEITERSHPKLLAMARDTMAAFGLSGRPIHLFKVRDAGQENAFVSCLNDAIIIQFCDNILSTVDDEAELRSVIGHELGHVLLGHLQDKVADYLRDVHQVQQDGEKLDPAERKLMKDPGMRRLIDMALVLQQVQELNADRVGILAAGDLDAAVRAGVKLAAGPVDRFGSIDAPGYIEQGHRILAAREPFAPEDLAISHPCEPLRAVALDLFWHCPLNPNATTVAQRRYTAEQVEEALPFIVPVAHVGSGAQPTLAKGDAYDQFLYMAIQVTVLADGKVTRKERDFIANLIRDDDAHARISAACEAMDEGAWEREYTRLTNEIAREPSRRKTGILKLLIQAAGIDRRFDPKELEMITGVASDIDAKPQCERLFRERFNVEIDWIS